MEIGRNCVPIVITVISNITVLVSHNDIYFGYFIPMDHGVNKKAALIVSTTSPPYQVFTWFVCCFARGILSTFSCSDYGVISVRHWKGTFDFIEIVNNYRFKGGTTCQIVRFISQFSLKLYIQFWKYLRSVLLGSIGRSYSKKKRKNRMLEFLAKFFG